MRKTTKKKIAPIMITALVIFYIAPPLVFILMAMGAFHADGGSALMWLPLLCWLLAGGAVIIGVLKALLQRLDEIDGGEEEEASKY